MLAFLVPTVACTRSPILPPGRGPSACPCGMWTSERGPFVFPCVLVSSRGGANTVFGLPVASLGRTCRSRSLCPGASGFCPCTQLSVAGAAWPRPSTLHMLSPSCCCVWGVSTRRVPCPGAGTLPAAVPGAGHTTHRDAWQARRFLRTSLSASGTCSLSLRRLGKVCRRFGPNGFSLRAVRAVT